MRVLVARGNQHRVEAIVEGIGVESLGVGGKVACAMPQRMRDTPEAGISGRFHTDSQGVLGRREQETEPLASPGRDHNLLGICDEAAHMAQMFGDFHAELGKPKRIGYCRRS